MYIKHREASCRTLDSKISSLSDKVDGIGTKLHSLETHQQTLEQEVRLSISSSASVSFSLSLTTPWKKCRTPVALQVEYILSRAFFRMVCSFFSHTESHSEYTWFIWWGVTSQTRRNVSEVSIQTRKHVSGVSIQTRRTVSEKYYLFIFT